MMIVVMNRLEAPPEFAGRIEEGFVHAAPTMREVAGFVDFRLLRLVDDGDAVLYIAETTWRDEASYAAWVKSDSFSQAHAGGGGSGRGPLKATIERFTVALPTSPTSD